MFCMVRCRCKWGWVVRCVQMGLGGAVCAAQVLRTVLLPLLCAVT